MEKYEVGGCVRDDVMGRKSKDTDYVVVAPSFDAMRQMVVADGGHIFTENPEFFTIRARVGKDVFDYVWARREGPYVDGRRPSWVESGSLMDDLARRDFTMNAMARDAAGTLIDPFGGYEDIRAGIIRTVGNPDERFREDGLRILRAIRFSVVFGFFIEAETQAAMERNIDNIASVSVERIREEMEKAFVADTVATIKAVSSFGFESAIFSRGLRASATMKG